MAWLTGHPLRAILILAVLLRFAGVIANSQANDPHLIVSQIMAYQHRMPGADEVWEGFQPRLYHGTVALLLMALPADIPNAAQVRVANAVSGVAGVMTLWLLLGFLRDLPLSLRTKVLTFALVAFNPKMFAVSIQATNDAFVILFATLAVTYGYRFFLAYARHDFVLFAAGILLACVAKGSGLPLLPAALITFAATLRHAHLPRRRLLGLAAALLAAFTLFVPVAGGYVSRYMETGDALYSTQPNAPPPHFLERTVVPPKRPGILSIASGYFTFRLVDLLEHPISAVDFDAPYAMNRTSLWTYGYASAHTNLYEYFPPEWQLDTASLRTFLRCLYLIALVPTALLLFSGARQVWGVLTEGLRPVVARDWAGRMFFATVTGGYVAFLMLYTYQLRDYATMKPVFIYTAVTCFMTYFALGLQQIEERGSAVLRRVAIGTAASLSIAYLLDTCILLLHLTATRLSNLS